MVVVVLVVSVTGVGLPFVEAVVAPSSLERAGAAVGTAPPIAAGSSHSLAVVSDGTVRAWGANASGQLGNGSTTASSTPVAVTGIGGVRALEAGLSHSLAVVADETVRSWGNNGSGQLGDGTTTTRTTAVVVPGLGSVSAVAAGSTHSLAITDGSLRAWGSNSFMQLGDGSSTNRRFAVAVAGVSGTFVAVAAGEYHSLALTDDGKVWAWGYNNYGQLGRPVAGPFGDPPAVVGGLPEIAAVASGQFHSMALGVDGRVWAWGRNNAGQLGSGIIGVDSAVPRVVSGLSTIVAIAAGSSHSLAATGTGSVRVWGSNSDGQLGNGTCCANSISPVTVSALSGIGALAGGSAHSLAAATDRTAWGWGNNASGQLGDGTTTGRLTPVAVLDLAVANVPSPSENLGAMNLASNIEHCQATSDPVNCATGNFWHTFADLAISGRGPPIALARTYNSLAASTDSPFGFGWSSTYTMSLAVDGPTGTATVTQENGSEVRFPFDGAAYAPAPRILAALVVNPDGSYTFTRRQRERFDFSAAGQLVAVSDLNGHTTTLSRPDATTTVVADQAGRTLTLSTSGGRITSAVDSTSPARSLTYAYDGAGNLVEVTDVNGGRSTFTYDGAHRLVSMRDPKYAEDTTTTPAPVLTNNYDAQSRVVAQSDPLGRLSTFDYTTTPGSTTIVDPKGNVEVQAYAGGVLVSRTEAAGTPSAATWSYLHDPATLGVTEVTDPNGHVSTRAYDARGNVTSVTDALGRQSSFAYDGFNSPTSVTDPSGVATTMAYDSSANLLSVSRPLLDAGGAVVAQAATIYNYGEVPGAAAGDVTSVVDATGRRWSYTYDAYGNRSSSTDALGHTASAAFDLAGRQISATSPRGNEPGADPLEFSTAFAYAPDNLLTSVTDPLGGVTQRGYDLNRNLSTLVDPLNKTTTYTHDPADQLTAVTRADTTTLAYGYFPDGSLASYQDGAGAATSYTYDPRGALASSTDPLGRSTASVVDAVGNPLRRTDPGGDCAAVPAVGCTIMAYDDADQLVGIDYSDPATADVDSVIYDLLGRRVSMADATGTSMWVYDSLGRLSSSTSGASVPGGGRSVGYGYDLAGRLTSLDYPDAGIVSRAYDDAGRLVSVTDPTARTSTFSYDADDNLTGRALANGTSESLGYDEAGRLGDIVARDGAVGFAAFGYERDLAGQVTAASSTGAVSEDHDYAYSPLNQLAAVDTDPLGYDPADNLTLLANGSTQAFDAANQLCHVAASPAPCGSAPSGATIFDYDPRGNRVAVSAPGGDTSRYGFDQADRLTQVPALDPSDVLSAGEFHSVLLSADRRVGAVGRNVNGQLGDATTSDATSPVSASGVEAVTAVRAGAHHSVALGADGTVMAWGRNTNGQIGTGTTSTTVSSASTVDGLGAASGIAAGARHSLALGADGTVWGWGANANGQLGNGANVISQPTPVQVSGLSDVKSVAAGGAFSVALRTDGTVWAWGANANGQLGDATTTPSNVAVQVSGLSDVTAIAAGDRHALALLGDGTLRAWGRNSFGQLGDGTTGASTVSSIVTVSGLSDVVSMSAGALHSAAVRSDGTVWAWGHNAYGNLGDATTTTRATPVQAGTAADVVAVSAGGDHTIAVTEDGSLLGWGRNNYGQIATGTGDLTTPTPIPDATVHRGGTYTYNGDGLRMAKTTAAASTAFSWDHRGPLPLLLSEHDPTGTTSYLYGPHNKPLARISPTGETHYYHSDQLGSTRVVTDDNGDIAATTTYDPHGELTASTGTLDQPLGYTGEYTDHETGYVYLRARHYDPTTAQYLTRDPIEAISGEPYSYAYNNPLNYTDPTGLIGLPHLPSPGEFVGGFVDTVGGGLGDIAGFVDEHKVGILQGGSVFLGVGAIVVTGGTASFVLAGGSALLAVGAEAADPKACRGERIVQTIAISGMGLVGGVLWRGAAQSADMAGDAASVGVADNIGRGFGFGDLLTSLVPDPCNC